MDLKHLDRGRLYRAFAQGLQKGSVGVGVCGLRVSGIWGLKGDRHQIRPVKSYGVCRSLREVVGLGFTER